MNKITMAQLSAVSGAAEPDINNWHRRLDLATKYEKPRTGPAQPGRFTRENAMEITLIAQLVGNGMYPVEAAARVRRLLDELKNKKPGGYVLFFGDNLICNDKPPSERLLRALDAAGVVVNLGKISGDIDRFFAD